MATTILKAVKLAENDRPRNPNTANTVASTAQIWHYAGIKTFARFILLLALLSGLSARAATISFNGSYTNDFSTLGTAGTTMPSGFRALTNAGGNSAFTAASPITTAAIAGAAISSSQALIVWATGSAVVSSSTSLYNCGSVGNNTDRALGTDPTTVGAMVIELSMTNKTGTNLPGVIFSYDLKCLTNGTGGTGTEASELPGYSFFYSTTGGSSAGDWTKVNALSIGNSTQGTVSHSGSVAIIFPSPLTNNGIMYFRWADDNCVATSPDQMIAIDNIGIEVNQIAVPATALTAPANDSIFLAGTNVLLTATASESDGTITNVAFYVDGTKLADVSNAPYQTTWLNVSAGSHVVTATAFDGAGVSDSASANVTVYDPVAIAKLQRINTVFVIAMENHNFTQPTPASSPQQILGNPAAPFINSLITPGNSNAAQVCYATHYYNAGVNVHPSEPSYVWAEAGTDFGVHTDNDPSAGSGNIFTAPHLAAQMNTAGITWKTYQEDVQFSTGPTHSATGTGPVNEYNGGTAYHYAAKHNPTVFFSDTQNQNVFPLTNFLAHLTNNLIGRYNWITPSILNDMHDSLSAGFTYHGTAYTGDQAAVAQGDNFLSIMIPRIMKSAAYTNNGLIVIWWDETEGGDTTSYTIPEIIISPLAKGNAYASTLEHSHSSDIKMTEEIFGLPFLANRIPVSETRAAGSGYNTVGSVNDFNDMFVPPLVAPSNLTGTFVNGGGFELTFGIPAQQSYRVLKCTDLRVGNWIQMASGTAASNSVTVVDANVDAAAFYRVVSP